MTADFKFYIINRYIDCKLLEKEVADSRCYAYVDMKEKYFTLRRRKFKSACGKCEGSEERK